MLSERSSDPGNSERFGSRLEQTEKRARQAERRTEEADRRTELAMERTRGAERRTLLANERTFSAWLRTGLASIGGGLAVARLLGGEQEQVLSRTVGVLLVFSGAGMGILALWRYIQVSGVLEEERLHVLPIWVAWLLAGGLVTASVLVLVLILLG